jgi:hypothetical protein
MANSTTAARDGVLLGTMSNPSTTAASMAPQASHDSTDLCKSTPAAGWAEPGGMGPKSTAASNGVLLAGMSNPSTAYASVAPQASHDSTNLETAIDSRETARILGLSPVTLQQIRARGEGPTFFRIGRTVRYRLGDVIAWRNERTVGRKTP